MCHITRVSGQFVGLYTERVCKVNGSENYPENSSSKKKPALKARAET